MIRIKTSSKVANVFTKKILTSSGRFVSVSEKLDSWLNTNPNNPYKGIFGFLKSNIQTIIKGEPTDLEQIICEFNAKGYQDRIYCRKKKKLTKIGKDIKEMFNYDGFRNSKKAIWLAESLKIKSCTYCNAQYTLFVYHNGKTKLLFHFDHFFPKSKYPYLSLSFYNLIPCCASCNMSKSDMAYTLSQNIHPYIDSLDEIARYEATSKSLTEFILNINKNENKIDLKLNVRNKYLGDLSIEKKLENYKNEFKVESQYQQFKDVVGETYLKGIFYNTQRKKELINFFKKYKGITLNEEVINRFILGNYTEDKDLLKRPIAKLMRDIGEDFKLV